MDINEQIAANTGLIYSRLRLFNLQDDQDAESSAYEALHKAVLTYDKDKGATFANYAICVIDNSLRMHLRKMYRKRQLTVVSYNTPNFNTDKECLLDVIKLANDAETRFISNEACKYITETFVKHVNALPDKYRAIIELWYHSTPKMSQTEIAAELHISQPNVSRVIANFVYKLKKELEEYM